MRVLKAAAYSRSHRVTENRHGELCQISPHIITGERCDVAAGWGTSERQQSDQSEGNAQKSLMHVHEDAQNCLFVFFLSFFFSFLFFFFFFTFNPLFSLRLCAKWHAYVSF